MDLMLPNYQLRNLSNINVLVGRNGIGKSNIMRHIANRRGEADFAGIFAALGFINPERGGELQPQQGIESNLSRDQQYIWNVRASVNQSDSFRQQVATRFRMLKDTITNDAYENKTGLDELSKIMVLINSLLENIEFKLGTPNFVFKSRSDDTEIPSNQISSGEAEIVSLAIEVLHYIHHGFKGVEGNKLIAIDEPDVHLHPDLQARFMNLLAGLVDDDPTLHFLLTTHSISIVGAVANHPSTRVCYLRAKQSDMEFEAISDKKQRLLPILGTNLLSRTMMDSPLLVVEGLDDLAIWNQAVRTSLGEIRVSPCPCYSKTKMEDFEKEAAAISGALYDTPLVLSLQDGDGGGKTVEQFEDGTVHRYYLQCYAAENLVLTEEAFAKRNALTWEQAKEKMAAWVALTSSRTHTSYPKMKEFMDGGFLRKSFPLKTTSYSIMEVVLEQCEIASYRWHEIVGKCIGDLAKQELRTIDATIEGSMANFLGADVVTGVIKR